MNRLSLFSFCAGSIIIFLFFPGCCTTTQIIKDNNLPEVKIEMLNAWLNLMPGGPGSFHVSGTISVTPDSLDELKSFSVEEILIYKDIKPVYAVIPELNRHEKDRKIIIDFYSKDEMKIKNEILDSDSVKVSLKLSAGSKQSVFLNRTVKLERAY